jgi:hypothetical protein
LPGVQRQVTGFFFPELSALRAKGEQTSSRFWYVALRGRPRGPFSAAELVTLAKFGRLGGASMLWRPGFSSWARVDSSEPGGLEDLTWLLGVIEERRQRERAAEQGAQQQLGIRPVLLTRSKTGSAPAFLPSAEMATPHGLLPAMFGGGNDASGAFIDPLSGAPADPRPGAMVASAVDDASSGGFSWQAEPSRVRTVVRVGRSMRNMALVLGASVAIGLVAGVLVAAAGAPWVRLIGVLNLP